MTIEDDSLIQENKRIALRYTTNLREALKNRSLKIKQIEQDEQKRFAAHLPKLDTISLFWLGLGLYWAEGAKTERWRVVFYNSDPMINKVMMRFFREYCSVADKDIRIQMVLHQNVSEAGAKTYWSRELAIPVANFYRASFILSKASKQKRPIQRLPYGTVQISVRGKDIANKIKGWLLGVSEKFISRV